MSRQRSKLISRHNPLNIDVNKYNDAIYAHSKLKKIFDACIKTSSAKIQIDAKQTTRHKYKNDDKKQLRSSNSKLLSQNYSYRLLFTELCSMLQRYGASVIQLQIYCTCPNLTAHLYNNLLDVANITISKGTQTWTECVRHSKSSAIQMSKLLRGISSCDEKTKENLAIPLSASSYKQKSSNISYILVNGATERDLFSAAHVCTRTFSSHLDKIMINIAKLTYPVISPCHISIQNHFNQNMYLEEYKAKY